MPTGRKGIDEFSIARAFAAVGVAAALYGISLSAGALISQPPDAGKEDVKWFLRHSAAPESVHEVPKASTRPGSFWTESSAAIAAPHKVTPRGISFWDQGNQVPQSGSLRMAGDLERSAGAF